MRPIKACLLAGCLHVPLAAFGAGMAPSLHPETFCVLGAQMGMPTGAFTTTDFPGCSSPPRPVTPTPGANRLHNTLAYYSLSQPDQVRKLEYLSLMLNVNNPHEAKQAYAALMPAATKLSAAVLGHVPEGLEQAIMAGKSRRWKSGGWVAELQRKEWAPASSGHQLAFRLRPSK